MFNEQPIPRNSSVIAQATLSDYDKLASFLNQNIYVHRHLDWFSTLDWLGHQPFLMEIAKEHILSFLCAAPENDKVAWLRTFGIQKQLPINNHWQQLLSRSSIFLKEIGIKRLGALALHPWFEDLLISAGFQNRQNVVVLAWNQKSSRKTKRHPTYTIRTMLVDDLPAVQIIDQLAFDPLWQNSQEALHKAFIQSGINTVAEHKGEIIGYQISTTMTIHGHLARLAVHPNFQRQGIAFTLVDDLLRRFENQGLLRVTVNTQSNNIASLNLYQELGFKQTGEEILVYELDL